MNTCVVADVNVMMVAMAHGRNLGTPYAGKRKIANDRYSAIDRKTSVPMIMLPTLSIQKICHLARMIDERTPS